MRYSTGTDMRRVATDTSIYTLHIYVRTRQPLALARQLMGNAVHAQAVHTYAAHSGIPHRSSHLIRHLAHNTHARILCHTLLLHRIYTVPMLEKKKQHRTRTNSTVRRNRLLTAINGSILPPPRTGRRHNILPGGTYHTRHILLQHTVTSRHRKQSPVQRHRRGPKQKVQ